MPFTFTPSSPVMNDSGKMTAENGPSIQFNVPVAGKRELKLVAIDGGGHVSLFTHLDPIRTKVRAFIAQAQAPYDA